MASFAPDLQNIAQVSQSAGPGALTATGNGSAVDVSKCVGPISAIINVSAVSGTTPQAVFFMQYSSNGGTTWTTAPADDANEDNSVTVTTAGIYLLTSNQMLGKQVRLSYTITGTTPSFTTDGLVVGFLQKVGSGYGSQTNFTPGAGF